MTEESLPEVLFYTSHAREKRYNPPPLIEDARQNPLVLSHTAHGTIYVKDVAFPTARQHMLVVPDQPNGEQMEGIENVPQPLLGETLQVVGDIATFYEHQPSTEQVDVMINFSADPLKQIQSQPNLHIHVVGWGLGDEKRPTSRKELRANPELRPQENEPLHSVIYDLLEGEVFLSVSSDPAFSQLFERRTDERGAVTFTLKQADATFSDPNLPRMLQEIHIKSQEVYNNIASAFFKINPETGSFKEDVEGRYKLLPPEDRVRNITEYITRRPYLSTTSQRWLQFLAKQATELENLFSNEQEQRPSFRRNLINRFAAIKGLAYACVFSGIKTTEGYEWEFGFDPIVFSTRGGLQASRGIRKVGIRDPSIIYDPEDLKKIKASEKELGEYLVTIGREDNHIYYQPGPQLLAT